MREVNKIHRTGITAAELAKFKTILDTSHVLLFDSLTSLTGSVHAYHIKNLTFTQYEELITKMKMLTTKEINSVIKKYIDPTKLNYSLAGNFTELTSQLKNLRVSLKL